MPTFKELYPQYYTDEYQANGPEVPPDPNPDVSPISQYSAFATMGRPNPREMTMSQIAGQGELPRYADVRPPASSLAQKLIGFTGGNYARDYAFQQQRFDAAQEHREQRKAQQAEHDAQIEMTFDEKIRETPPEYRGPILNARKKWYKTRGIAIDPEWDSFYKKAQEDDLALAQKVAEQLLQDIPEAQRESFRKDLMTTPTGFANFYAKWAALKKLQGEAKAKEAEGAMLDVATQTMKKSSESPTSPESSGPSAIPRPAPMTQPGPSQGPQTLGPSLRPINTGEELNLPTRNNNPTNIKVGPATVKWIKAGVAEPGDPAQDSGRFLKFKTPEVGFQAADDLLQNPFYADKTVEDAMRAWSGKAYGAEILPQVPPGTTVRQLGPAGRQTLVQAIAKREGFGKPYSPAVGENATDPDRAALQETDKAIAELDKKIKALGPATMHQGVNRYVNTLQEDRKILAERRKDIEKRYEGNPSQEVRDTAEELFPGKPWVNLDTKERGAVMAYLPERKANMGALAAKKEAEATEASKARVSAAQGENAVMRQPLSDTDRKNLRVYDAKKDDWVKIPVNWNQQKLQESPQEVRHMVPVEGKPADDYRNLAAAKAAAANILPELEKPEVQKEIGNIFSNPEAWLKRVKAKTGKDLPESVYKIKSELSRLQATLQRYYAGTAQTATELKTLDPFIVHMTDPTPLNAKTKLKALLDGVEREYSTRRGFDLDNGSYVPKLQNMKPAEVEAEPPPEGPIDKVLKLWKSK